MRFNPTGTIDARNGGDYAAATAIPYTAGTTYHFRLDVNLPARTYDIYVTPAGASERLLGSGFAFRAEQATVSVLNNLGLYAKVGSAAVCNPAVSAWTPSWALSISASTTSSQRRSRTPSRISLGWKAAYPNSSPPRDAFSK